MNFQKKINRRIEVEKSEETKYYEEMWKKRTTELLGINNENIFRVARGVYGSQYFQSDFS